MKKLIDRSIIALTITVFLILVAPVPFKVLASSVSGFAINLIQNAGSALPQRPILDCSTGMVCTDDPTNNRTLLTASGSGFAVQIGGTPLTGLTTLNLVGGTNLSIVPTNAGGTYNATFNASGSASGGASIGYSAPAVTLPAAGTTYVPVAGGGLPSATETNVQWIAPLTSTFSDLGVLLSSAIGAGNTITITARDNATAQSVTCTISGATAKTCTDSTDTFNVAQGDLLTYSLTTTGVVAVAPTITIAAEYGGGGSSGGGTSVPFGFAYTPLVPANWSLIGSGASVSTITGVAGGSALKVTGATGGGSNGPFGGITIPATGTNYTHTFVFYGIIGGSGNVSDQICPVFTDGTNWEGPCVLYQAGGSPGVGVTSLRNSTFANGGSLNNAVGNTTSFSIAALTVPLVFMLVKTGAQLQGYFCPDGQNVAANCLLLFTDTTPFLTPNAVALIGGARGGSVASIAWLESYL